MGTLSSASATASARSPGKAPTRRSTRTSATTRASTSTVSSSTSGRSLHMRAAASGDEVEAPAAARAGRDDPGRLAGGALRAGRRGQVLSLPQGPRRDQLVPHPRLGDAHRLPRPGGYRVILAMYYQP